MKDPEPASLTEEVTPSIRGTLTNIAKDFRSQERAANYSLPEEVTVVGKGSGRLVCTHSALSDHLVLKFALPTDEAADPLTDGITQNAVESHLATNSIISAYIIPIIAAHAEPQPFWIIQPRAEICSENDVHYLYQPWDELQEKGIRTEDFYDPGHWGFYRGQHYLVDAGYIHPDKGCALRDEAATLQVWMDSYTL